MPLFISQIIYNLLVKLTSEEWVAYYILKTEPPTLAGLKEGKALLNSANKRLSKENAKLLKEAKQRWNKFCEQRTR
jgi:ferritin-like protein